MINAEEQKRFALRVKKNTITLKGRIKELAPPDLLKIYHVLKNK
jgi:hypothetical protein